MHTCTHCGNTFTERPGRAGHSQRLCSPECKRARTLAVHYASKERRKQFLHDQRAARPDSLPPVEEERLEKRIKYKDDDFCRAMRAAGYKQGNPVRTPSTDNARRVEATTGITYKSNMGWAR